MKAPKYARAFSGLGNLSLTGWLTTVGPTVAPALSLDAWRRAGQIVSVAVGPATGWYVEVGAPGVRLGGGYLGGKFHGQPAVPRAFTFACEQGRWKLRRTDEEKAS